MDPSAVPGERQQHFMKAIVAPVDYQVIINNLGVILVQRLERRKKVLKDYHGGSCDNRCPVWASVCFLLLLVISSVLHERSCSGLANINSN